MQYKTTKSFSAGTNRYNDSRENIAKKYLESNGYRASISCCESAGGDADRHKMPEAGESPEEMIIDQLAGMDDGNSGDVKSRIRLHHHDCQKCSVFPLTAG